MFDIIWCARRETLDGKVQWRAGEMIMCREPLCMFYCTGACMDILYINLLACMAIMWFYWVVWELLKDFLYENNICIQLVWWQSNAECKILPWQFLFISLLHFFSAFFASYIFFQSPRCPIFISYSSSANTYIDSTRMAYTCAEGDLLCAEKYMDYCIKILLRIFV